MSICYWPNEWAVNYLYAAGAAIPKTKLVRSKLLILPIECEASFLFKGVLTHQPNEWAVICLVVSCKPCIGFLAAHCQFIPYAAGAASDR